MQRRPPSAFHAGCPVTPSDSRAAIRTFWTVPLSRLHRAAKGYFWDSAALQHWVQHQLDGSGVCTKDLLMDANPILLLRNPMTVVRQRNQKRVILRAEVLYQ